jgi:hypothetical protein
MSPMRRSRASISGRGALVLAAVAATGGLSMRARPVAAAEPAPPPTASAPVGDPEPTPPPAVLPTPPPVAAPASGAGLEAADTAPAGAPPGIVEPLGAPSTTAPGASFADAPAAPAPRPRPFYRQGWFWAAAGVLAFTAVIIGVVTLQPADPATPDTRLGDKRAF